MDLEERGQILRQFELGIISTKAACQQLSVTRPTLYRQLKKYRSGGIQSLRHGNTGQVPANKLPARISKRIEELLLSRYSDFQPALAKKYLKQEEGIEVSEEYLRKQLVAYGGQARRKRQTLHQSRRRRSRFGELIQIDGSPHQWFGSENPACCLLVFVDDATGKITAAKFAPVKRAQAIWSLSKSTFLNTEFRYCFIAINTVSSLTTTSLTNEIIDNIENFLSASHSIDLPESDGGPDFLQRVSQTVISLNKTVSNIDAAKIKQILGSMEEGINSANTTLKETNVVQINQLLSQLTETAKGLSNLTGDQKAVQLIQQLNRLTASFNQMTQSNRYNLRSLLLNLAQVTSYIADFSQILSSELSSLFTSAATSNQSLK